MQKSLPDCDLHHRDYIHSPGSCGFKSPRFENVPLGVKQGLCQLLTGGQSLALKSIKTMSYGNIRGASECHHMSSHCLSFRTSNSPGRAKLLIVRACATVAKNRQPGTSRHMQTTSSSDPVPVQRRCVAQTHIKNSCGEKWREPKRACFRLAKCKILHCVLSRFFDITSM
jgi:hypothetical protein